MENEQAVSNRAAILRFADFELDPGERRLVRDGRPLELQGRYFDALVLLAREPGRLISKDRFFAEVWNGIPVTDEALTQCIRTLRRALGDKSENPAFIETVPKHGYRFIAPVDALQAEAASASAADGGGAWPGPVFATMIGGGVAGAIGGMTYGFLAASQPGALEAGSTSLFVLVLGLAILAALLGALGLGTGIAIAWRIAGRRSPLTIVGSAVGGLAIGALVKMFWLDAFRLVLGRYPGDFTGPAEGLILGAGVGLGVWASARIGGLDRPGPALGAAAAAGAGSGALVAVCGLRLMGGSLEVLAKSTSGARWSLAPIGQILGERNFGPVAHLVTASLEGALFASCIAAALLVVRDQAMTRR